MAKRKRRGLDDSGRATSSSMIHQAARLFPGDKEVQQQFLDSLTAGESRGAALKVRHYSNSNNSLDELQLVEGPSWLPPEIVALAPTTRIGTAKSFLEGDLYGFELASAFSLVPVSETPSSPAVVFDMCAAPGGKAIGAWTMRQPEILLCNEVIGKRLGALSGNLERCRISPVKVMSADPERCGDWFENTADLVIADVPCSGQALVAKGRVQPGAFHRHTVEMNARRQRRVVIHSARVVAPGGFLLYTTCTFAIEENEQVIRWLLKQRPDFETVSVSRLAGYESPFVDFPCYRLFPQRGEGAGAFTCLLRRREGEGRRDLDFSEVRVLWSRERRAV